MLGRSLGEAASTSSIGLAVAAATLATAFVVAQLMVAEQGGDDGRDATYALTSTTGLALIVGDAGRSAVPGLPWEEDPDQMTRFGLAKEGQPNFLDYAKIRSLRNGTMIASPNDQPDYPEVKAALGIIDADFHLRTYPVIPGLDDPRWVKEVRGRIAYVGHVASAQGYGVVTSYANTSGATLTAALAVRNTGAADHIFTANVGLGNAATGVVIATEQRHTRLLAPGETQVLTVEFPRMAYDPAVTGIKVELADGYGGIIVNPAWTAATPPTSGTQVSWTPKLSAGKAYYESGETVKFLADHYKGDGSRMSSAQNGRFVLVGPDGKEWVNTTTGIVLPKNKPLTWECANCTVVGNYTATLWDTATTRRSHDHVHVSAASLFTQSETLSAVAMNESAVLASLVTGFNGRENSESDTEGDIFTDAAHIRALDTYLSRYTTLVVGSEVRQNALNAAQTKWSIADWVQAGGNLVVLGTMDSQSNWLEPVYHAAQQTANGGISAPDPTHPILVAPNRLSYDRYLDRARAWDIEEDQPFTHVLTRGSSGNSVQDTLTVSEPGAYNGGTVVLTSYMPGSLTEPQDPEEARRLLHNLLSQSYTMLFLDYGPPIPSGVPVGSDSRLAAVEHPNVPGAVVEVRLVMYVFG